MATQLLRPWLAREHEAWLEEMQEALGPARQAEAGTWARWNALRYLEAAFPERVRWERRMVRAVAERLSEPQRARLWALGELLELFPGYLARTIGLCHRAEEFGALTGRLETALDRWCQAVEEDLGSLPVTALPPELRETNLGAAAVR